MTQYAWAVLGLGLGAVGVAGGGRCASAQTPEPGVELRQNHPNPFNPATTIPFRLRGELFLNGHRPVVTLHIYNVIAQMVAVPILRGTGQRLDSLPLSCSSTLGCSYNAYWDGYVRGTGRLAASGVYIYQLVVDGLRFSRKMVVIK
jgi:hypothetical protein